MTYAITDSDTTEVAMVVNIQTESLVLIGQEGFAGAEAAEIEVDNGIGLTEVLVAGAALSLTVDDNVMHLRGPGRYVITKPTTAGAAHLFMCPPARAVVSVSLSE